MSGENGCGGSSDTGAIPCGDGGGVLREAANEKKKGAGLEEVAVGTKKL